MGRTKFELREFIVTSSRISDEHALMSLQVCPSVVDQNATSSTSVERWKVERVYPGTGDGG